MKRRPNGSVLPFLALGLTVLVAFVAFSVDMTRNLIAVNGTRFAADAAALYAYSMSANADGTYSNLTAQNNILTALAAPNGQSGSVTGAWNSAPAGPTASTGPWFSDVTFAAPDVTMVTNPADANEQFLQLTGRREGNDSLTQLFMPSLYNVDGSGTSAPNKTINSYVTVEVVGQPASRIGPGAPHGGGFDSPLAGFACFPLALCNAQFASAASSAATTTVYTIDIASSQNQSQPVAAGHIRACLVNDIISNSQVTGSTYSAAQGNPAIDQLVSLIGYFNRQAASTTTVPSAVERGVMLNAFDTADSAFQSRKQDIVTAFGQIKAGQVLILPVIQGAGVGGNPSFATGNQVVGFAVMQVVTPLTVSTGSSGGSNLSMTLQIGNSIVMRNATSSSVATLAGPVGSHLISPVAPFTSRSYTPPSDQPGGNSLSIRPRGVVLAAALSPRSLR